jgi:hypothetical protein
LYSFEQENLYVPFGGIMKTTPIKLALLLLTSFFVLFSSKLSMAASRPIITSHTPQYSDGALIVTIQWQSDNPVIKATLMAAQEQKKITLENDNRRIPEGYHGEAVISATVQQSMGSDTIVYSLQLEDEYHLKSELVQGRLTLPKQAMPGMSASPAAPAWGQNQGQIQPPQNQQAQPGQLPPIPHTGIMQQQLLPQDAGINQQQGMMPQQQGMMPQQQGMMPQQQGIMPQQQEMMPQQQGMMPQQQGMMPQQQGMMPQQQDMVPPPPPPPPPM